MVAPILRIVGGPILHIVGGPILRIVGGPILRIVGGPILRIGILTPILRIGGTAMNRGVTTSGVGC